MKKLFTAALALVFAGNAMAIDNEPEPGVTYQAFLGFTASKINGLDDYKGKVGGTMGIKMEYMLPNAHGTYINLGVDWTMKGAKNKESEKIGFIDGIDFGTVDVIDKMTTHYLEIPIHVGFRYNVLPEVGVFAEVGPYFAIGVGGKHTTSLDADGSWTKDFEESYAIFKNRGDKTNLQRWDAGFGFRVGAEYMNKYSLNLGCDWGFTDMYRDDYRDIIQDGMKDLGFPGFKLKKIKNFNFVMSFGYRF